MWKIIHKSWTYILYAPASLSKTIKACVNGSQLLILYCSSSFSSIPIKGDVVMNLGAVFNFGIFAPTNKILFAGWLQYIFFFPGDSFSCFEFGQVFFKCFSRGQRFHSDTFRYFCYLLINGDSYGTSTDKSSLNFIPFDLKSLLILLINSHPLSTPANLHSPPQYRQT